MNFRSISMVTLASLVLLSACDSGDKKEQTTTADTAVVAETPVQATSSEASSVSGKAAFDISSVPVSTVPLGAFPYLGLPQGYEVDDTKTLDFTAFPVWTGSAFQMVEGKVYMARIDVVDGKTMSRLELQRNIDAVVRAAGGVRVAQGKIPGEPLAALPEDVRQDISMGWGDIYNNEMTTYVIRRADQTIWVHFSGSSSSAAWSIIKAEPFVATATLTPPPLTSPGQ